MTLRYGRIAGLLLAVLPGCPADDVDDTGAADTEQADTGGQTADTGSDGSETDADCVLECSGNGQCVLEGGIPSCDCDEGFEEQGLDCVDPNGAAAPPDDFTCPSPGDVSGADAARFVSQGWSYVAGSTSCERQGTDIYRFREDGVVTRHSQSAGATEGGNFVYGCWTLEVEANGALGLQWDPVENESQLNCGFIGGLEDPPNCEGSILFDAQRDAFVLQDLLDGEEVHLLYPAPEACVWCSDEATCCPDVSWVEANGELLCE
ncbi:MAG: hypothetical protein ACRBN8_04430 [Nannocystales bacterium]